MKNLETIKSLTEKYNRGAIIEEGRFLTLKGNAYEIKDKLKEDNFKFDPQSKEWYIELETPISFECCEIKFKDGVVEELEYNDSFDQLLDGEEGLFIGKTDNGYSTIEI